MERAFSLARLLTWMLDIEEESPLRASEGQLFKYVLFLEKKFTGALSGRHFCGGKSDEIPKELLEAEAPSQG